MVASIMQPSNALQWFVMEQLDTVAAMQRVIAFVNTRDVDDDTDAWDSPQALAAWLRANGLAEAQISADDADLDSARTLREGLRAALLPHDAHGDAPAGGNTVAAVPLQLQIDAGGHVVLAPAANGVAGALARLVAPIAAADADGTWSRVKACPQSDCQWAFLDQSRNRSRRWCSMEVCGNRAKTRTFRDRHRDGD
jgi:predicted RNA-binding Zn ribbon-like protein